MNFYLFGCRNYKQDTDEEESEEESEEECSEDDDEDEEENDYKAMGHSCECLREIYPKLLLSGRHLMKEGFTVSPWKRIKTQNCNIQSFVGPN